MISRRNRRTAGIALAAAGALALAGCTTADNDGTETGGGNGAGTITVGVTNALTSLNSSTITGNLDVNGMVAYLTGAYGVGGSGLGGFYTLDEQFSIVPNENIGTVETLSEDPLTVQYTLADDLTWSDGEAIDANDLLLGWAISSGYYDDFDPAAETGTAYFEIAGSTAGLDTTAFPEIADDLSSLTITYAEPFADYQLVNLLDKPAHVLAEQAGVSEDEFIELLTSLPEGDPAAPAEPDATLQAAADFWNTGYDITSFPSDESLLVASGPFIVTDFVAEQSVTLGVNPEYAGGDTPAYDELIITFIGDASAQVTALQNGEVDAIQPQPSADTLTALEAAGLQTYEGNQLSYDHVDLNFGSASSTVFADANVREAFLKTIPRQQILDSIITPINPEADVLNSQIFVSSQPEYAGAAATNGYDAFAEPDIEGALALLGGATPTVRILYNTNNPNRVDSFQAIQSSAAEAGFTVVDAGSPDWGSLLSVGDYDASIFGWVSPGAGNAALPQIFATGGGGNYNNYSNPEVDELVAAAQTELDSDALEDIKVQIDTLTAQDFYGLPLFQSPGLFAGSGTVDGITYFGGQTGIFWNAHEWTIAS